MVVADLLQQQKSLTRGMQRFEVPLLACPSFNTSFFSLFCPEYRLSGFAPRRRGVLRSHCLLFYLFLLVPFFPHSGDV